MKYDPAIHHRRSIRLNGYDYRQPGAYFTTTTTFGREPLFGEVTDGEMHLSPAGKLLHMVWLELPRHYPNLNLD